MESSIDSIVDFLEVSTEQVEIIYNTMKPEVEFETKYNIKVDDIKMWPTYIEYLITVPEQSELKSEYGFHMEGIYLAKRFKELIISLLDKLHDEIGMSKVRVKIRYTLEKGSKWTEEESNNAEPNIESLDQLISKLEAKSKEK